MKYTGTLLLLILLFTSVDLHPQEIVGLWMVDKVEVGDETMTPVSRWMRFSENNKHEAGNGWLKHSEGTYAFDKKKNTLSVETKNQPTDPYGPFSVDFEKDKMFWSRVEDGANVKVVLIQIEEIPSSPANEMLGEWRISADDDDPVYGGAETLFLRWDNIFVLTTSNGERKMGVYKFHGHRSEYELIFYGDDCDRSWWKFDLEGDAASIQNANDSDANPVHLTR